MEEITSLVNLDKARQELAAITDIRKVKKRMDQVETLRIYAKRIGASISVQNKIAEYKIRYERRAGELIPRQITKGGNPKLHDATLKDLGIEKTQSHRWQQIASIPEERFENFIALVKDLEDQLTSIALLNLAKDLKRTDEFKKRKAGPLPKGKFNVIYADLPWEYYNKIKNWGPAELHYETWSIEKLSGMSIPATENAVLFMWVTNPFVEDALKVIRAWSFEYKTNMVWVKKGLKKPGSGFYVRGRHELLFICTRGSFVPYRRGEEPIGSVIEADVQEHSKKPDIIYEIIEKMYSGAKYLELFARNRRDGWEAWGDEL